MGQICLPSFPGLHLLRCVSDVGTWKFKRLIHNWIVVLEFAVHASVGLGSKAVSRVLGTAACGGGGP